MLCYWRTYNAKKLLNNIKVIKENYSFWIENGPFTLLDRLIIILLIIYVKLVPERIFKKASTQILSFKVKAMRKRRDRFLKKYKKTGEAELAEKANSFTKSMKRIVKKECKRMVNVKVTAGNSRCFWNSIAKLQGKYRKPRPFLMKDGKLVYEEKTVDNVLADGFLDKLNRLTSNQPPITETNIYPRKMAPFTMQE